MDHVFISPELAQYLQEVQAWDLFADHTIIGAKFEVPVAAELHRIWPAYIPYEKVNLQQWHAQAANFIQPAIEDPDQCFQQFGKDFERSFQNTIDAPGGQLPPATSGRCKLQQPEERPAQCPLLTPSRPGEVQPASELLGRTVQKWFLQLRRMQSMLHALKAGKTTWDAQIYRADLWRAIKRAKGYEPDFNGGGDIALFSCKDHLKRGLPQSHMSP